MWVLESQCQIFPRWLVLSEATSLRLVLVTAWCVFPCWDTFSRSCCLEVG